MEFQVGDKVVVKAEVAWVLKEWGVPTDSTLVVTDVDLGPKREVCVVASLPDRVFVWNFEPCELIGVMSQKALTVGNLYDYVASEGACSKALEWLGEFDSDKPASEVYALCSVTSWLWWLYCVLGLYESGRREVVSNWLIYQEARDTAFDNLIEGDSLSEEIYEIAVIRAEQAYLASRLDWSVVEAALRKELG